MRLFAFSKDGIKKKDLRCGRGQNVDTCLHSVGVHVAARVDADGGGGGQICPLCHLHDVGCAKAAPVVRCDENSVYKSPASIYSILQLVSLTRLTSSQEFPSWMFLKANRKRQMRPTSYCPVCCRGNISANWRWNFNAVVARSFRLAPNWIVVQSPALSFKAKKERVTRKRRWLRLVWRGTKHRRENDESFPACRILHNPIFRISC